MKKRIFRFLLVVLTAGLSLLVLFFVEIYLAINQKLPEEPFNNPAHTPMKFGGSGSRLMYVVIGDSTGAGRGAAYGDGIAVGTAKYLGLSHQVTMVNLSVSGALSRDVLHGQLTQAEALKPDAVLLAVGANDATHFTPAAKLKAQLTQIVDGLCQSNPNVKIVVTGCPQMGSIPRFLQPLRWFAGTQTARINTVFAAIQAKENIVWAHIADKTGAAFEKHPALFAFDKFHPNARGYALWLPVLDEALWEALSRSRTKE